MNRPHMQQIVQAALDEWHMLPTLMPMEAEESCIRHIAVMTYMRTVDVCAETLPTEMEEIKESLKKLKDLNPNV